MTFDPLKITAALQPKKRKRDKRYGTLNRRMLATSIDQSAISLLFGDLTDRWLDRLHPLPPFDAEALQLQLAQHANDTKAANQELIAWLANSGYVTHAVLNLTVQFLLLCIYSAIFWYFWSSTPGKMLLRMKIVDEKTGLPIRGKQIADRVWGYMLSFVFFGAGFFWVGVDKRAQGWHDKLAHTLVIVKPRKSKRDSRVADPSDSPAPSKAE